MILNIQNLIKRFEQKEVLNIPQLTINEGGLIGVLGNNGAGKTTLFRLCLDLLKADEGFVLIDNENVSQSNAWKKYTSAFIDAHFLIDFLTPEEYFYYISDLYGISKKEIDAILVDFIPFMDNEILNQKKHIDKFSKGNKQKIGIIGAMLIRPRLLILDEPFNFLDPSSQIIMKRVLREYNQKYGTAILLSSHNIQHVTDICTRIVVLEAGGIIRDEKNINETTKLEIENYVTTQLLSK
ncbi:ATP-binding protein [Bacteroidia bacterium]|nr:ATP-binding protein [Bacteroidia bacterium]GHV71052.1 ATP-binding protein [Bacteroidia bacterium]